MDSAASLHPVENMAALVSSLVEALPETIVVTFAANLHCTLARGLPLARWGLAERDIVGQPVTALLTAIDPKNGVQQPSAAELQQMCQAALDGVESVFEFGPVNNNTYSVRVRPISGGAGGGLMLMQCLPAETLPETALDCFIETAPDAMIVTDTLGQIVMANSHMETMFGYSAQELVGQSVEILLPSHLHKLHRQHRSSYVSAPKTRRMATGLHLVGITKQQHQFPVDISLSPVHSPRGMLIVCAIRDVTEQKQTELALRQTRDDLDRRVKERTADLESRNEELDTFAQTVAHDLKNPLSIMTGMAELMLQYYGELTDDEMHQYLELIARDGRKLDNIINELMVLAGLSHIEPNFQPTNVANIAEKAINRLDLMIKQYQASVSCNFNWPWANSYAPWIETVWVNYISNAIKYGGSPPVIELGADAVGSNLVRFWIKDNGHGLTENEQSRLFTAFTRLSDVRVQGYGVGLSIVKRAVEKLGGQVGVESQVGHGSLFYFTLPAAEPPPTETDL